MSELVEKAREIVARHFPDKEGIAAGLWDSHGVMKVTLDALNASTLVDENAMLREVAKLADELVNGDGLYTVAYADTPKLCVRERKDNSDPHYRLCEALAALSHKETNRHAQD